MAVSAVEAYGYAARDSSGVLSPWNFTRRETNDDDVRIKVLYCGICHTDYYRTKNLWNDSKYPVVPGHEITGLVTEVGSKVEKFKVGDKVGVGAMCSSCLACVECYNNLENYCAGKILTYNSTFYDGSITYGGYSDHIVVKDHYVMRIPDALPLDAAAPLLCAGVTVYSSMKFFELDKPGLSLGVVGLGGHGHLVVKFAKAFGATKVTVISSSPGKESDAIDRLKADAFIDSSNSTALAAAANTMDGVIDVGSVTHDVQPYINMLKTHGKLIILGAPATPNSATSLTPLINGRRIIGGSTIGGMKETQQLLHFAAQHNILPDIEVISIDYANTALERLGNKDVRYRFVIDVGNTLKPA